MTTLSQAAASKPEAKPPRLQELAEDEARTKRLVGRVRSRASLGEGWRLYAPGAHVGLGCETKHNVIEKQSFSNGKFSGVLD